MNARKSKFLRKLARAMTTSPGAGYTPHQHDGFVVTTARCLPGTFKAQYRALKGSPNALSIMKAMVAK